MEVFVSINGNHRCAWIYKRQMFTWANPAHCQYGWYGIDDLDLRWLERFVLRNSNKKYKHDRYGYLGDWPAHAHLFQPIPRIEYRTRAPAGLHHYLRVLSK